MRRLLPLAMLVAGALNATAAGRIIILNSDKPGVGFNESTAATPIGGNMGTTIGQQRLNVFEEAARRWQNSLDIKVDVLVTATFAPIPGCTDSEAVLGQAGPMYWKKDTDFAEAPKQHVWYPAALANNFAGRDLDLRSEIFAQFNADVDSALCLSASDSDWYYGFDGNKGNDIDLFVVVLHELAHGLGVAGKSGGSDFSENRPAVFNTRMLDLTSGLRWDQMSAEQRRVSITNTGNVVWDGEKVREHAKRFLLPITMLTVTQPAPVARNYDIGYAGFGPEATAGSMSGRIVLAQDAANADGPSTTDGCTALTNPDAISGNIALIDRGGPADPPCTFVKKALHAQAAGARGVIIADNRKETCVPPGLGGTSADVNIPVVSITQDDGAALKAQLTGNVQMAGLLRIDPSQLAGASQEGYVRLYAPCTAEPGSSTYHWDVVASPNLLMEPNVSSDLVHGLDLTLYQLLDMGWALPARTGRTVLRR
ncbi:MAG TPA: PA domain-containing protein [Thermoanaerobaculia bacterium]|nr:PA domain-containing protein [Thermoanaerobaculia bacterium]